MWAAVLRTSHRRGHGASHRAMASKPRVRATMATPPPSTVSVSESGQQPVESADHYDRMMKPLYDAVRRHGDGNGSVARRLFDMDIRPKLLAALHDAQPEEVRIVQSPPTAADVSVADVSSGAFTFTSAGAAVIDSPLSLAPGVELGSTALPVAPSARLPVLRSSEGHRVLLWAPFFSRLSKYVWCLSQRQGSIGKDALIFANPFPVPLRAFAQVRPPFRVSTACFGPTGF
jgi:hypothetical protein